MPEPAFDCIVLGLGAMGSAACFHLACRGARVLGIDRFSPPHGRGSSHGHTRMIRSCYFEHPGYVPLLRRAYDLWRDLERESRRPLLHITGGIYMGPPGSPTVDGSARAAREHTLAHEVIDRKELTRRYPAFSPPEGWLAFVDPLAGYLLCEDAIAANLDLARRDGAVLLTNEPVLEWSAEEVRGGGKVRVRTAAGEYSAPSLIITAGAWAGLTARGLGVAITPTRQTLAWFPARAGGDATFARGRFPVWAADNPEDGGASIHYGFPIHPGEETAGVKAALHKPGEPIDPDDDAAMRPRAGETAALAAAVQRLLPDLDSAVPLDVKVCMYENSPDGHFIVDRHPLHANVLVAAGFSGHGFKFAPVIGEALADLAMRGSTPHPIGFLGLSRFRGGAPPERGAV